MVFVSVAALGMLMGCNGASLVVLEHLGNLKEVVKLSGMRQVCGGVCEGGRVEGNVYL